MCKQSNLSMLGFICGSSPVVCAQLLDRSEVLVFWSLPYALACMLGWPGRLSCPICWLHFGCTDGSAPWKSRWLKERGKEPLVASGSFPAVGGVIKEIGQVRKPSEALLKLPGSVTLWDLGHQISPPLLLGAPEDWGAQTQPFFSLFLQVILQPLLQEGRDCNCLTFLFPTNFLNTVS